MDNTKIEDDEIDLLDLFVTLAESWVLLIVGPIVVAAFVFGYLQLQTTKSTGDSVSEAASIYASSATVSLPEQDVKPILSFENIELALEPLNSDIASEEVFAGLDLDEASDSENSIITLSLPATINTKEILLNLLNIFSANYVQELKKSIQEELTFIAERRLQLTSYLSEVETALERINENDLFDGTAFMMAFDARFEITSEYNSLDTRHDELIRLQTIQDIEIAQLSLNFFQFTAENKFSYTEGQQGLLGQMTSSRKLLLSISAGLGMGFLLLIVVLMRKSVQNIAKNPERAAKMAKIKRSFMLK